MDKQILNFTVNEQILVCENPIKISTNKVNYIQAHFDLGDNWSGYNSIRAVWFNDFNCISTVLDSLGNCAVPFEVMKRKGNVKVNLVGSISEDDVLTDRLTSYPVVAVIVDCTAQITGANTSPITPSEYEQFVAAVHEDAERAEAGATASEQSAQNAHTSEQNASQSAQSAHNDKIAIEQAIAEVIQQIEDFEQVQVVVNTLPPSSQATSDFTNGVLTLGIPQGVKGDTGNGIQSIAKVGTSGLVDTYRITYTNGQTTTFTVTNGAKGDTGNGIQSIVKTSTVGLVDTYTITYTDGTTTTFTVTNGEKGDKGDQGEVSLSELEDATIVQTLSDNEPYNYRRTNNGLGSGHREYDEIVGASVGWNQLVDDTVLFAYTSSAGVTITKNNDGTVTINGTASNVFRITNNLQTMKDHVCFVIDINKNVRFYDGTPAHGITDKNNGGLIKGNSRWELYCYENGTTFNNTIVKPMVVDLTLFNSAIADYVYTLEQSTAGSGVAWLKTHFPKLFDNGYQPFDAGSIKSVSGLTAHEMVGKNLFDGPFNTMTELKLSKGVTVTASCLLNGASYGILRVYDENETFLQSVLIQGGTGERKYATITLNNDIGYCKFEASGGTGLTDIQIELGSTATPYEPYEKHTYPLDSSVVLRGQYKLDANNNLYAVGDVYEPNGTVTRRYGVVDLGTLNYSDNGLTETVHQIALLTLPKANGYDNFFCTNYVTKSSADVGTVCGRAATSAIIFNAPLGMSVSDFKTSMSGQKMVYELATPTTESAEPYTNPQWSDSHGTEEYVGSELPVGHNTDFPMSLVDTMPTTNGTFEPRVTVTNGVRTVTWVSV